MMVAGMSAPHEVCRTSRCVVLLVDDEPLIRRLTARALNEADYDVIEAGDGVDALRLLRSGTAVDIIVSDVVMPRMTGVELAHTVQDEFPRVPVILVSGYTSVECAPFPFLSKPFELPQLVGIITETLASGEAKA